MCKVSICIPAYRQPALLGVLIESILEQKYSDYEVIVSDDSPGDEIRHLLEDVGATPKFRYYRNVIPLKSPANWNQAVQYARGEYIKIMHHDDYFVNSNSLGGFVQMLDENPSSLMAFCASNNSNCHKGTVRVHRPTPMQLRLLSREPEVLFAGNFIGAPSATIYRRSCSIFFDDRLKWLVDVDFYIRLLKHHGEFEYNSEPRVYITTGAEHQVTRECEHNRSVELTEHMILFEKIYNDTVTSKFYDEKWFKLFEKYGVRQMHQLGGIRTLTPEIEAYFANLFLRARSRMMYRFPWYIYHYLSRSFASLRRFEQGGP